MTSEECINEIAYKTYEIYKQYDMFNTADGNYRYACGVFDYFESLEGNEAETQKDEDLEDLFREIYNKYKASIINV